jgi:glycerate kinase
MAADGHTGGMAITVCQTSHVGMDYTLLAVFRELGLTRNISDQRLRVSGEQLFSTILPSLVDF